MEIKVFNMGMLNIYSEEMKTKNQERNG